MGSQDLEKVNNLAQCMWCLRKQTPRGWLTTTLSFLLSSDRAAGSGASSSGPGAIKWCCCQCISATGAGGAAGVGTDVVLHTASHVNDTASAHGWSWSIRNCFLTLYRFTTLCNYPAYTPACLKLIVFQHTCKLQTALHKISIHLKNSVWTF